MIQTCIAVLAGLVVGVAVIALGEGAGRAIFPPPFDVDPRDAESIRAAAAATPLGGWLISWCAWVIGVFAGAGLAAFLAPKTLTRSWWMRRFPGWLVAGILCALCAANLIMVTHPVWMWTALAAAGLSVRGAQVLAVRVSKRGRAATSAMRNI